MAGPRETLIAAIVAQLETIRMANGYSQDVGRVFRVDLLPEQINDGEFPALQVLESVSGESMSPLDDGGYACRLPMTIAGILKSGTVDLRSSDRHTAITELLGDTISALMEDPTFSAACKESMMSNPVVFVDPDRPEAMFNLTLTCLYHYGRANL